MNYLIESALWAVAGCLFGLVLRQALRRMATRKGKP